MREFEFRRIYIAANISVNRTVELLVSEYNTILSIPVCRSFASSTCVHKT